VGGRGAEERGARAGFMVQLAPGVVIYTCNKAPDRRAENKEEAATKHTNSALSQVERARRQILQMAQQRKEETIPQFIPSNFPQRVRNVAPIKHLDPSSRTLAKIAKLKHRNLL